MKITIELTEEQYQAILKLLPKTTYPLSRRLLLRPNRNRLIHNGVLGIRGV